MKSVAMFFALIWAITTSAAPAKLVSCQKAKVDLTSLVGPIGETSRYFHNSEVAVYYIDQMEPVCCSAGVAITLPDVGAEQAGLLKCVAVLGYGGIEMKTARSSTDPVKGLLIEIDTREYTGLPGGKPGPTLRVRLNMKNSKVTLE